ncbi:MULTISPECIES: hypothetical protein [Streptomyces]|uniref:hypothetical protein n=1 Tax=Streptomyces TaxID=1883 RepID=UPI002F955BB1
MAGTAARIPACTLLGGQAPAPTAGVHLLHVAVLTARAAAAVAIPPAAGAVFPAMAAAAASAVRALSRTDPYTAVAGGSLALLHAAALVLGTPRCRPAGRRGGGGLTGAAFGALSRGALHRALAAPADRGRGRTSTAYHVLGRLSTRLPVIAAGAAARQHGPAAVTRAYALGTAVLAAAPLAALTATSRRYRPERGDDQP